MELLYDAYYDELEQYANQQQPADGHALAYPQHSPGFEDDELSDVSRASDEDDEDEDEEDDEEEDEDGYEDEDDEDEYDDDVSNRKAAFPYRSGFPNTLQAKGIATPDKPLLQLDMRAQTSYAQRSDPFRSLLDGPFSDQTIYTCVFSTFF